MIQTVPSHLLHAAPWSRRHLVKHRREAPRPLLRPASAISFSVNTIAMCFLQQPNYKQEQATRRI